MAGALDGQAELEAWLAPFLALIGHKARRQMLPLYLAGLIGPGTRKSIQPMARRLAPDGYDRLHHFVAAAVWDPAPLERRLWATADELAGGRDSVLVVDEIALPKRGKHSVGVDRRLVPGLGRTINCQVMLALILARGDVATAATLRLMLPESWTGDEARLDRAGVPEEYRVAREPSQVILAEIDRLREAGTRFGRVLIGAGHGADHGLRQGLAARGLAWITDIGAEQPLLPVRMELVAAETGLRGGPRLNSPAATQTAADLLAAANWQGETGAAGSAQREYAMMPVRVPDGPGSGETLLLTGERTAKVARYHLSNGGGRTDPAALANMLAAGRSAAEAARHMREDLGLGHFEGRSWNGLRRHALLTTMALAFLAARKRAELADQGKAKEFAAPLRRSFGA
jgi:SRSO17 transposase